MLKVYLDVFKKYGVDAKSGNAPKSQNWVKGQLSANSYMYVRS